VSTTTRPPLLVASLGKKEAALLDAAYRGFFPPPEGGVEPSHTVVAIAARKLSHLKGPFCSQGCDLVHRAPSIPAFKIILADKGRPRSPESPVSLIQRCETAQPTQLQRSRSLCGRRSAPNSCATCSSRRSARCMSGDPLRFPLGRRVLQRGMQTSRSKTRKSCQRNIRSVRGSPTATIQRLLAYSVHEFRFSLSPSYPLSIALYKRGRQLSSCDFLPGFDQTRQKAPRLTFRSPSACAISIGAIASAWLRRNVFQV